jgi:hypothetical protein
MTRSLRDDDLDEVRQLVEALRQELTGREAAQENATADATAKLGSQDGKRPRKTRLRTLRLNWELEISRRRRGLDALMADLHERLNAPYNSALC